MEQSCVYSSFCNNHIKHGYNIIQICERIRVRSWRVIKDAGGRIGPYAYRGDQWVSFDDDFMVRHKVSNTVMLFNN